MFLQNATWRVKIHKGLMTTAALLTTVITIPDGSAAEWDRAKVEKAVSETTRDAPLNLETQKLSGLNLSGIRFGAAKMQGVWLDEANLSNADLSGATLDVAIAPDVNLSGATLRGASLFSVIMTRANLEKSDLSNARIGGDFNEANLKCANLSHADGSVDMQNQSMGLMNVRFDQANLSNANLSGANLTHSSLRFAELRGANLRGVNLTLADLAGADFTGADLTNANLAHATVTDAVFKSIKGRDTIKGLNTAVDVDMAIFD
jgi:uncharacterized protein YjbI with pentapeptide repeats